MCLLAAISLSLLLPVAVAAADPESAGVGSPRQSEPSARPLVEQAQLALSEGDLEAATSLAQAAVEGDASCSRCWALLGRARAQRRDFLQAEEALLRARDLGASDGPFLLGLGSVLWENGHTAEAEAILGPLGQSGGPIGDVALHELARLWVWQGRYDDAVTALRELVARRPTDAEVRLDLARALDGTHGEGTTEEAISHYRSYLEQAPDDAGAAYNLAMALQRAGDRAAAAQWLQRSTTLREAERSRLLATGQLEAVIDQARHLLANGHPGDAVRQLEDLEASSSVLGWLARAYRAAGDHQRALDTLERAVAMDPGQADLRLLLQDWRLEPDGSR